MKTGTRVYCKGMNKKLVVAYELENENIVVCIDFFVSDKEHHFKTYLVDKDNLQIGWNY